jgi:hypothetical protein
MGNGGRKKRRLDIVLVALLVAASGTGTIWMGSHRGRVSGTLSETAAPAIPVPARGSPAPAQPSASPSPTPTPTPTPTPPDYLSEITPTAGAGEHPARILPAAVPPPGTGGYLFLTDENSGETPQYDPCRAIHYVVRDKNTPVGGDDDIRQAVAAVSRATGLQFIDDGTTTEVPNWNRPLYQPKRYGDRWAPVLIAWTDPTESPDFQDGKYAGLTASRLVVYNAKLTAVYVTGQIELDAPQFQQHAAEPNASWIATEIIEHELGHLVGLAHVADPTQIMNGTGVQTLNGYGAGDLRGLAIAGSGACHPEV